MSTHRPGVQAAVQALPRAHAVLLRGAMSGFDDDELSRLAGLPRESVRPMLRLAAAKLGGLLTEPGTRPPAADVQPPARPDGSSRRPSHRRGD